MAGRKDKEFDLLERMERCYAFVCGRMIRRADDRTHCSSGKVHVSIFAEMHAVCRA